MTVASLMPPTLAGMARDQNEIGYVCDPRPTSTDPKLTAGPCRQSSLRIGFCYFTASFAILTGTPIVGALLGTTKDWTKPIVFSGVRASLVLVMVH